jgi:hypothetical protein
MRRPAEPAGRLFVVAPTETALTLARGAVPTSNGAASDMRAERDTIWR